MKIARQGIRFLLIGLVVTAAGAGLGRIVPLAGVFLSGLGALFFTFCLWFFRDPERPLPSDSGALYSPGDGRVLTVGREGPGEEVTARIFLSVFDVHIQRAPVSGVVEEVRYQPGSFLAAMKEEARANERCAMTIRPEGGRGRVVVEQIAGLIARRIECWPKAGEKVAAGARYGIIYFGSQAAVHFPKDAVCTLRPGQRVVGGVTEIGRWR